VNIATPPSGVRGYLLLQTIPIKLHAVAIRVAQIKRSLMP
jgi:hypothetical protein